MASDLRLKEQLPELTKRIVETYSEVASISHLGHCPLPNDARFSNDCHGDHDFEALGQAKAILFLEELPELRRQLALDVQAAHDGDPAVKTLDEIIFCYPGLEAVT